MIEIIDSSKITTDTDPHYHSFNMHMEELSDSDSDSGVKLLKLNARIHERNTCKCPKLKHIFDANPSSNTIIAKLYHDNPNEDIYPKYLLASDDDNLEDLLYDSDNRIIVFNYFMNGIGELDDVRKSVESLNTFCYCKDKLFEKPNAGTILFGSKEIMCHISGMFNFYFSVNGEKMREEYQRLLYCKIIEINKLLSKYECDHTIINFLKSSYYKSVLNDPKLAELYTVIGLNTFENKIGFSFGKREFISNDIEENSYICSLRELFEEFRINMSHKLKKRNNGKFFIHYGCCRLYPLVIPPNTTVSFDKMSKTINLVI